MNALTRSIALASLAACAAFAGRPDTEGAKVGVWTQDYDAAVALAKEKGLPLMLNFTGSDWCGWCKLMDNQVFSKSEWKNWAKENIVLAFIDFPRKKSLVPEKYVARNKALSAKYGVQGYPTYILVEPADGKSFGQLGASRDATPAKFIEELEGVLLDRPGVDLAKLLSAEDMARLAALRAEKDKIEKEAKEFGENARKELTELQKKMSQAEGKDAKAAAEMAIKARFAELDKAFEPTEERAKKTKAEIVALLKKAHAAKLAATPAADK